MKFGVIKPCQLCGRLCIGRADDTSKEFVSRQHLVWDRGSGRVEFSQTRRPGFLRIRTTRTMVYLDGKRVYGDEYDAPVCPAWRKFLAYWKWARFE